MIDTEKYESHIKTDKWKEKPQGSNNYDKQKNQLASNRKLDLNEIKQKILRCIKKSIYSVNEVNAAGFRYVDNKNIARCDSCGLEISVWTLDKRPHQVHQENSPDCPSIQKILSKPLSTPTYTTSSKASLLPPTTSAASSLTTTNIRSVSLSSEQESPLKRQKIEGTSDNNDVIHFTEVNTVQQIRKRTFSHWPHRTNPSSAQMTEAGFFNCNVGDRVICIYCNLICQQWTPHTDDPCEVHTKLSPNCIYVKSKLLRREPGSILIVNESSVGTASNNLDQIRCNELVHTVACHGAYSELPKRTASFAAWPGENLPDVDELVKAGFFYTGTKNIVTCFYCNGSLQNWGANDNPTIEHARWFPHCAYAKQLCGDDLYRKIQESKRAQQERARANESRDRPGTSGASTTNTVSNSRQLLIPDESTLSRLVAARLDLAVSQRLLQKKLKISIIKRCWEDQLRLKLNDFISDSDLHMACMILQKQIENIDGKKENIVIPSIRMKKLREDAERQRTETHVHEQASAATMISSSSQPKPATSNNRDVEMTAAASQSATNESTSSTDSISKTATTSNQEGTKAEKSNIVTTSAKDNITDSPTNPCVLCLSEEKRLACIPCGHLATCVPCGHSLRSCPICRREIEAFVRNLYLKIPTASAVFTHINIDPQGTGETFTDKFADVTNRCKVGNM